MAAKPSIAFARKNTRSFLWTAKCRLWTDSRQPGRSVSVKWGAGLRWSLSPREHYKATKQTAFRPEWTISLLNRSTFRDSARYWTRGTRPPQGWSRLVQRNLGPADRLTRSDCGQLRLKSSQNLAGFPLHIRMETV